MEIYLSKPGPDSFWASCLELKHDTPTGHLQGAHFSLLSCLIMISPKRLGHCSMPGNLGRKNGQMGESTEEEAPSRQRTASPHHDLCAHLHHAFGGLKS